MKKLLLSLSLSLLMIPNLFADNPPADEPELSADAISQTLSPEELAVIDRNEEPYVYLTMDVISCLKELPRLKDMPESVKALQEHVHQYKSYPYDYTLSAVKEAINYLETHPKVEKREDHLKALREYQTHLNSGEAIVVSVMDENATRRRSKCKRFCRLIVQDCLKAGAICVVGDINVGGNVNVKNTVRACDFEFTCPCDTTKTFEIPQNLQVAGTITQNVGCNGGTGLFLKSGLESLITNIRGTFALSNLNLTVDLDLTTPIFGITVSGSFGTNKVRPLGDNVGGWNVAPAPTAIIASNINIAGLIALSANISVNLSARVKFVDPVTGAPRPFASEPTVVTSIEFTSNDFTTLLPINIFGSLGLTGVINNITISTTNVTTTSFDVQIGLDLVSLVTGLTNDLLENLLNTIFGRLLVNFIAEAPSTPAA
jgi:hypothetical protein